MSVADTYHTLRRVQWEKEQSDQQQLLTREWLVTNGLGGYASGTVAGVATRRYHGLLIAALPSPLGRTLLLSQLSEKIQFPDGRSVLLGGADPADGELELHGAEHLAEFRLEQGLPVWRYEIEGAVLEKRVVMPHEQNTVHVSYHLLEGKGPLRIKLLPTVAFRSHDASVSAAFGGEVDIVAQGKKYELRPEPLGPGDDRMPPLRFRIFGAGVAFTVEPTCLRESIYRVEKSRGYDARGQIWSPGYFRADLDREHPVTLVASTESWENIETLNPTMVCEAENRRRRLLIDRALPCVHEGVGAELVLAADQFVIRPAGRPDDSAWAHAAGEELRSIIAGYHWFTDWGRDTMISLEGLTLVTGRHMEASYILRTFAHYTRDGLIPNHFPEGDDTGVYNTVDASLWFFHAVDRYLDKTDDRATLHVLLPTLRDIVAHYRRGTQFGIRVDPEDGLVHQGADGYQLTWMDAKVDGWVVTPRRGKAVEINALWYNALRLLERWLLEEGGTEASSEIAALADQTFESFNHRFWNAESDCLFDVVDGEEGDDPACRPNQIFAISLPHAVLRHDRWDAVMQTVQERLLTPFGLRSLAPGHPDYKPIYDGDLRSRDAAYHQGTTWAWLIGPFYDAWHRVYPDREADGVKFLDGLLGHLSEACIGNISEIFDADSPYRPRGCVAQAWSVAEVLRCYAHANSSKLTQKILAEVSATPASVSG